MSKDPKDPVFLARWSRVILGSMFTEVPTALTEYKMLQMNRIGLWV